MNFLWVFLGGGIGSVLRYGATLLPVPCPTVCVNVLGCFLIGLFHGWSARWGWGAEMRLLLTTGLCGGFTTFSTFSAESLELLRAGRFFAAAGYVGASVLLGLLATFAGAWLAR